jgi:hypothetical protein
VQVDPIKPTLKVPETKQLKLKHIKLLSNVAFKFNLRRYNEARERLSAAKAAVANAEVGPGRSYSPPHVMRLI